MLRPRQLLHRVDQQFAAFGVEFEFCLIHPNELHPVDVSAAIGGDGIDDHTGVQLESDLARLDQLITKGGQPIGLN